MTISIEKSKQQEKDTTDTTKAGRRQPTYKVNPLILNRWSPWSMTGEELDVSGKKSEYNKKYSITHQYDAGAAWENLALEASSRGLVAHGMQGFDYEKARKPCYHR